MNDTSGKALHIAPGVEAFEPGDEESSPRPEPEDRGSSIVHSLLLVVGLPTLLAAIYFGFIASDIYISETRYAIRSSERAPAVDFLTSVLSPSGVAASSEDTLIVRDYILSRDMLNQLQARLDLKQHYSSEDADWLARLKPNATEEDFLEYYRNRVEVLIDSVSNITLLRVRAFDPELARSIAQEIVERSEVLINKWSERITEDTLRFARNEVDTTEGIVREASTALTKFRNEFRSIDPSQETSAVLGIITGLEAQLADAKAQLIETTTYMRSDSQQAKQLRNKVAALERQIDNDRNRLAGQSGTELTRLIDGYEPLLLEQNLAAQRYASALTSLEVARAEAQRKQRYLIPFVTPELPDEPLEPERLWNIFTVFIGALLLYAIGALVWAAITDHVGR